MKYKYEFVNKYPRFNLWYNKTVGYHECFRFGVDPNKDTGDNND